jgi:hypothetical protein
VGDHQISVFYTGDTNFTTSVSDVLTQTVYPGDAPSSPIPPRQVPAAFSPTSQAALQRVAAIFDRGDDFLPASSAVPPTGEATYPDAGHSGRTLSAPETAPVRGLVIGTTPAPAEGAVLAGPGSLERWEAQVLDTFFASLGRAWREKQL